MSIEFNDHTTIVKLLEQTQSDDSYSRDQAREDKSFIHEPDGMWEDNFKKEWGDRPRYTLDLISHQIDNTAGEIEQNEFQGKVDPMGGGATKETAKIFNGLLRNIQVASNASRTYQRSARTMMETGMDVWRIVADVESERSYKQVLKIQKIEALTPASAAFGLGPPISKGGGALSSWV